MPIALSHQEPAGNRGGAHQRRALQAMGSHAALRRRRLNPGRPQGRNQGRGDGRRQRHHNNRRHGERLMPLFLREGVADD